MEKFLNIFGNPMEGCRNLMFGTLPHGAAQHYPPHIFYKYRPKEEQKYFRFTFVRNPYDRMVSQYLWQQNETNIIFEDFLNKVSDLVSQDDFFNNDNFLGVFQNKIHFCPQYLYAYSESGQLQVDLTGRFESLQEDFAKVCEYIGVGVGNGLPRENTNKNRGPYSQYYNSATKKLVKSIYEKDLDVFKYTFVSGV